jgi:HPt (histidine-containing phosphotransfer) domain-containing protein
MMRWGLLPESLPQNVEEYQESNAKSDNNDAAIDLKELENMLGALDDMAVNMLTMFEDMTNPLMEDLKAAHKAADWHQFSEIGHSLKGSARSIGAMRLGDVCAKIQDDTEKADDTQRQTMLDDALTEYDAVKAQIKDIKDNGF